MTKFTIGVPVLLREDSHRQIVMDTIKSIKDNSEDYTLVIVDDGSPLMTGWLKDEADIYIRHKKNMGVSPSWNDILSISRSEYTCVCNDDIRVQPGWLNKFEKVYLDNKNVGVVGVKNGWEEGMPEYKWMSGFCFCLARETIKKIGLFNEKYVPFNFEDIWYWTKILLSGLKIKRAKDLEIWHKEGDTIHKLNHNEVSEKNKQLFIKEFNFDPQPVFFGDKDFKEVISNGTTQ